jgi:hypothetical protein
MHGLFSSKSRVCQASVMMSGICHYPHHLLHQFYEVLDKEASDMKKAKSQPLPHNTDEVNGEDSGKYLTS